MSERLRRHRRPLPRQARRPPRRHKGKAVKFAEAFEVCEYGTQPTKEELKALFPFAD